MIPACMSTIKCNSKRFLKCHFSYLNELNNLWQVFAHHGADFIYNSCWLLPGGQGSMQWLTGGTVVEEIPWEPFQHYWLTVWRSWELSKYRISVQKCILISNLLKCCLPITYCSVVKLFWNFAQSMAVSLPCSVQIFKTIWNGYSGPIRFQKIWD